MPRQTDRWRFFCKWLVVFCFLSGCGGAVSAPEVPDGSKITLVFHTDAGLTKNMKDGPKADQTRIAEWMTAEMKRLFQAGGYLTENIQDPAAFEPDHRRYMVVLTIDDYHSEEMYSHNETRLGNGVTNIRGTVELFKDNHTLPISRYTESVVSSRDWTVGAGELTKKMALSVSERIHELF